MADKKPAPSSKKTPAKPAKTDKPAAAVPKKAPAARKPAPTKASAPTKPALADPYAVIFHPVVTEKTMFNMDRTNSLEFMVAPRSSKPEIAAAVEQLFTCKVHKVTTRHTREGKRAVVRFAEGFSAEEIGTRIGVF